MVAPGSAAILGQAFFTSPLSFSLSYQPTTFHNLSQSVASSHPTVTTTAPLTEPELVTSPLTPTESPAAQPEQPKWPGWSGYIVYRIIVPATKVSCIIGRKGEAVKKLCAETRARVNVLHGPVITSAHRIVLVSSKEEVDAVLSPAMVAVMRLSRRINELPEGDEDDIETSPVSCCVRLLVPSGQAYSLIGRQGLTVKSMQEASGAAIQVFSRDEVPACNIDSDGWPGCNVYRLIVPLMKVGSIIGKKGETVKKLCVETGARVNVLPGLVTCPHRVVVISGKEDPDAALSPAMVAVMRLSKQVIGLPEGDEDDIKSSGAAAVNCCVRLLVPSGQAFSLIGRQGARIRPMQEASGSAIRVLSSAEVPTYVIDPDEKVVELEGEAINVLKALKYVAGHLRNFLVDHSVLPLFEKNTDNADKMTLNPTTQAGSDGCEYSDLSDYEDTAATGCERVILCLLFSCTSPVIFFL
ncbi:uncharacterized protein LOC135152300 [Daucus carota subsp. sativus]|uniref:uncharacterized protein LOC135152300 n=1 Tax=Daucus carota subsp. sativus TaxID=79200 RepID=UPI00308298EA